jgi:hypothetical protein
MSPTNDVIAVWALILVLPAVIFVMALFLRQLSSPESRVARTADRIAAWYAAHPQIGLWVLLLLLPLSAFILGSAALLRTWDTNSELRYYTWRILTELPEHPWALLLGVATLASAAVLAMITSHLMRA